MRRFATRLRYVAIWVLAFFLFLLWISRTADAAPPPPRPEQPREDLFSCGALTCDHYNPVTKKAKATRGAAYRLQTEPGCSAGTVPSDMVRLEEELLKVDFRLTRNDFAPDFTVRINCGSEQIRICGGVNVFCLNRGYPYSADVDISDIISTYPPATRLAILCHEICGHAVGSWNEQYARCGASCNFAPSPGWRDFMNTGPDSRHGFEEIELERWARTMYELQVCGGEGNPYWDACLGRWVFSDGWSVDPMTQVWYSPLGLPEWTACNADRLRWNYHLKAWLPPGSGFFDPARGFWAFAGAC